MSQKPHGMSSLPAGEGVGTEPCVDNAQMCLQTGLHQVKVILPQLARVKLSLVDNGLGGQRADVEPDTLAGDVVGGGLSQLKHLQIQVLLTYSLVLGGHKHLVDDWL